MPLNIASCGFEDKIKITKIYKFYKIAIKGDSTHQISQNLRGKRFAAAVKNFVVTTNIFVTVAIYLLQ